MIRKLLLYIVFCLPGLLNAQEIILIRHSVVSLQTKGWMSAKKAIELRAAYNNAPVYNFNPDLVLEKIPRRITDTVYISAMPRSITTGIVLFGDSVQFVSVKQLNEFDMHMVRLPLLLPYKAWTAISRGIWLMGVKKQGTESYKEAQKRVRRVCNIIEQKVQQDKQIILVTHGFINRKIAKELKKRGWRITQNKGQKNLGATVLLK